MAPEKRADQDEQRHEATQAGTGTAVRGGPAPKATPINLALAELQGEMEPPEESPPQARRPPASPPIREAAPPTAPAPPPARAQAVPPAAEPARPVEREPFASRSETTAPASPSPTASTAPPPRAQEPSTAATRPEPAAGPSPQDRIGPAAGRRDLPRDRILTPSPETPAGTPPAVPTVLALAGVVGLIAGIIGALAFSSFSGGSAKSAETTQAGAEGQAADADIKSRLDEMSAKFEGIDKRLEATEKRFDEMPRSAELTRLRRQVEESARSNEGVAELSKSVNGLDDRLNTIEKAQKELRIQIAEARADQSKPDLSRTSLPALADSNTGPASGSPESERRDTAKPLLEDVQVDDVSVERGAELFKQGKFADAYTVFKKLEQLKPDDARVWYFSALSHGLSGGGWKEDTRGLAMKGVEKEKAGNPATSVIDAAFKDLTSATGREWLAHYRTLAKTK